MPRRQSPSSRATRSIIAVASLFALAQPVAAHSWVEQLNRIASNGTMIDPAGFIRGYFGHADPGFSDSKDVYLLPPNGGAKVFSTTDKICAPQQTIGAYVSKYPKLVTAPGDLIALRHQENGHVSLPQNQPGKPDNRGTIYIYGTAQAQNTDTLLNIHKVWNAAGTGGDKRGKLLATRNYDDGQCYQVNSGAISTARQKQFVKVAASPQGGDLWCQSDLRLPSDLTVGKDYTLYWVWDWPTLQTSSDPNSKVLLPEVYTSCMDLSIVDPCDASLGSVKSPQCQATGASTAAGAKALISAATTNFAKGQDLNKASILSQLTNNFAVAVAGSTTTTTGGDGATSNAGTGSSNSSTTTPATSSAAAVPAASSSSSSSSAVGSSSSIAQAPASAATSFVGSFVGVTTLSTITRPSTTSASSSAAASSSSSDQVIAPAATAYVTVTESLVTVYATTVTIDPFVATTTATASDALTTTVPGTTFTTKTVAGTTSVAAGAGVSASASASSASGSASGTVVSIPTAGVAPDVEPFMMAKKERNGNARILGRK